MTTTHCQLYYVLPPYTFNPKNIQQKLNPCPQQTTTKVVLCSINSQWKGPSNFCLTGSEDVNFGGMTKAEQLKEELRQLQLTINRQQDQLEHLTTNNQSTSAVKSSAVLKASDCIANSDYFHGSSEEHFDLWIDRFNRLAQANGRDDKKKRLTGFARAWWPSRFCRTCL